MGDLCSAWIWECVEGMKIVCAKWVCVNGGMDARGAHSVNGP